jgi:hypothetical protein
MHMRRTIILVLSAWLGGLCCAGASAWAYTMLNAWRGFGSDFQLGYVAGYLDGLKIGRSGDVRGTFVRTGGRPDLVGWRDAVNAFYEDPANARKPIAEAMSAVGRKRHEEDLARKRKDGAPAPSASSPTPAVRAP